MSVKIRLARTGKTNTPFFRIVAIDHRVKRDGKYLENLGTYNPRTGEVIQFHSDKVAVWINNGAIMSDAVKKIQKKYNNSVAVSA